MNSTIAVSIDAGGCSLASMNPEGVPTLIANSDDGSFVTSLEIGMGGERIEIGQAARRYLEDDPGFDGQKTCCRLLERMSRSNRMEDSIRQLI